MKTFGRLFCVALLLPVLNITAETRQQDDHLKQYVDCKWVTPFTVAEALERTDGFLRPVNTAIGKTTVEVSHGFSLHIAYGDAEPFVNFKAEKLTQGSYLRDKQVLVDALELMAADTPSIGPGKPQHDTRAVFDVYSIRSSELRNGVVDVYLLFQDADYTVVTLYVLNPEPGNQQFERSKYMFLRDYFLRSYVNCVSDTLTRRSSDSKQRPSK